MAAARAMTEICVIMDPKKETKNWVSKTVYNSMREENSKSSYFDEGNSVNENGKSVNYDENLFRGSPYFGEYSN